MNGMYALYATYEQNRDYVGRIDKRKTENDDHSMQNAHITITLNRQGELIDASLNNQNSQLTIIPLRQDAPAVPNPIRGR